MKKLILFIFLCSCSNKPSFEECKKFLGRWQDKNRELSVYNIEYTEFGLRVSIEYDDGTASGGGKSDLEEDGTKINICGWDEEYLIIGFEDGRDVLNLYRGEKHINTLFKK